MFYDWSERVMSVLGTTKYYSCNQCIDTWQESYIVLRIGAEGVGRLEGLRGTRGSVEGYHWRGLPQV